MSQEDFEKEINFQKYTKDQKSVKENFLQIINEYDKRKGKEK